MFICKVDGFYCMTHASMVLAVAIMSICLSISLCENFQWQSCTSQAIGCEDHILNDP